jgi:hypothetical protein
MAVARTAPLDQRLQAILDGVEHGVTLEWSGLVAAMDGAVAEERPVDLRRTCGR